MVKGATSTGAAVLLKITQSCCYHVWSWGGVDGGAITSGWGKVPAPLEDRPKVPAPARPPAVHENLLALSDGAVDAANAARSEEVASLQAH